MLAHHYTQAGLLAPALDRWQAAAERAVHRSTYVEAIHSIDQALAQLAQLPPDEARDRRELDLQAMKLGPQLLCRVADSYVASGRTGEATRVLAEIQELMEQHGDVYWEPELLGLSGWLAAAGPFCKHLIGRVDQESLRLRVAFCASPCAWKLLLTYAVPFIVATLGRSGRVGARARKLTARLG